MTFEKIIKELKRIDKGLHELGVSDKQDRRIALNESCKILEYVNEEMIKKEMLNQGSTDERSVELKKQL